MVQNDEMEVIVTIYIYFYDMGHYNTIGIYRGIATQLEYIGDYNTIGIYVRNAFMFDRKKINYNY